jgi:iron complex transport system permease protein|tara:strand:+ start:6292 stop:7317 length:1026 start_codon:yes stop_codon:yes gene_type:complete
MLSIINLKFLNRAQSFILFFLLILLLLVLLISFSLGSYSFPVLSILIGNTSAIETTIFSEIRVPRVILAAIVGASLSVSGACLQGLFRNPLADPGLIGVSAGAALGASTIIVFGSSLTSTFIFSTFLLPLSACLGSGLVILMLFLLTRGFGHQGVTYMLLVGIAVNAIASVGIGILTFVSSDSELRSLTFWTMGSFGGITWSLLIPALIIIFISFLFLLPILRNLDILQLGESEAKRLGVNVKSLKYRIIFASAASVGASVSLSGMIGFVGLVVPHLLRLLSGVNHTYVVIGSALLGSSLMVFADLLSRLLIQPAELPVGLITSAIGSPFFLWLIFRINKI